MEDDTGFLLLRLAITFYVLSAALAFLAMALKTPRLSFWPMALAVIGFAAHFAHLLKRALEVHGLPAGYGNFISFLCLAAVLVYVLAFLKTRLEVLAVVILPVVLVLLFISNYLPREVLPVAAELEATLRKIHIGIAVLGCAALFLTFASSVLYLVQERRLKGKRPAPLGAALPSLEKCDTIGNFSLMWGFPILTLTIILGAILSASSRNQYWFWESRETLALIAWAILAVIITARLLRGWRGRKAAYLTIVAFTALILRMLGVVL